MVNTRFAVPSMTWVLPPPPWKLICMKLPSIWNPTGLSQGRMVIAAMPCQPSLLPSLKVPTGVATPPPRPNFTTDWDELEDEDRYDVVSCATAAAADSASPST